MCREARTPDPVGMAGLSIIGDARAFSGSYLSGSYQMAPSTRTGSGSAVT